ncbi:hypothetical protein HPB48_020401 [Haemaphysalis longicornis]|uniref:Uncharacterized protein n=1 Tax=Haemaphysalis longicornis TaxID=44386 RepID=A0A9J6G7A8_HAELO|nr:hypothetical protein HPB48_020401 [Haemaphysalis longicornis]
MDGTYCAASQPALECKKITTPPIPHRAVAVAARLTSSLIIHLSPTVPSHQRPTRRRRSDNDGKRLAKATRQTNGLNFIVVRVLTLQSVYVGAALTEASAEEHDAVFERLPFSHSRCSLPLYDPYHWTIRYSVNVTDFDYENMCSRRRPTVISQNGDTFTLHSGALRVVYNISENSNVTCHYQEVFRNESSTFPDLMPVLGPKVPLLFGRPLQAKEAEYVQISCQVNDTVLFTEHFLIPRQKDIPARIADLGDTFGQGHNDRISVLVLGIDSTSRMNFHRHMTRTRKYLTEELHAFEFWGLNKVGESSFANQIPLLSGIAGPDAESLFRNYYFDNFPILWNTYKRKGYTTLFLEEMPHYGLFTYPTFRGFRRSPTDYYPVSILRHMDDTDYKNRFCMGSRLKTKGIKVIDEPLENFFKELSANRIFQNTALLILSDHGTRIGPYRMSEIGRKEDMMPFCFLVLPKRFLATYPRAAAQLEVNQRRLITPYDLHATLLSLSALPVLKPEPTNKGLNLFGRIPPERTCEDAFISPEFCACIGSVSQLDDPRIALGFANYAVSYINALAELHFPAKCVVWKLSSLDEKTFLGGRVAGKAVVRILITTVPTAHFEVYGTLHNESFSEKHVDFFQRLDWYRNDTWCLPKSRWQKGVHVPVGLRK